MFQRANIEKDQDQILNDDDCKRRAKYEESQKHQMKYILDRLDFSSSQNTINEAAQQIIDDPSVYQYDEHYEAIQNIRSLKEQEKKARKKANVSKLLTQRINAREKREREVSISLEIINSQQQKRLGFEANDNVFVTKSYKDMVEANEQYKEGTKDQDEFDDKHTENMRNFYRGIFNQQIFQRDDRLDGQDVEKYKEPKKKVPKRVIPIEEANIQTENQGKSGSKSPKKSRSRSRSPKYAKKANKLQQYLDQEKQLEDLKVQRVLDEEKNKEDDIQRKKQDKILREEKAKLAREKYAQRKQELQQQLQPPQNELK